MFGHFLLFPKIWSDISKIEEQFGVCPRFFKMFRPAAINSFRCKYKPGRPVNKETRRHIINRYLVGEGPSAISRSVRVTKGAVWKIIRHYEMYGTYDAFSHGGRTYSSKLSDVVLESIELFKLTKPCMYSREIRERFLNDGIWDRKQFQERLACPTRNFLSYHVRAKLMPRSRGVTSILNSPQEWIHQKKKKKKKKEWSIQTSFFWWKLCKGRFTRYDFVACDKHHDRPTTWLTIVAAF